MEMRDVGCTGNSSRGLIKSRVHGWQEDLYSSRIYSRDVWERVLCSQEMGEVNPNVSRCQIERCRSITQDWMVLEVLSDIVKSWCDSVGASRQLMCLHGHWYFRRNDYSLCLFFLSSWGKVMARMILWSVFWIGGDWVVSHIVAPLECDFALFVGVGVNILDCPWKNSIMRLIFVTFIQCEEVWGRVLGLNSMTRSLPTLRLASYLFILCWFSWCIVRGYIQHFSWEYLNWP